jgi:multidrug transporter EmrE-like cation transporter
MTGPLLLLTLAGTVLSALAQVVLKLGMSSTAVQQAINAPRESMYRELAIAMSTSPWLWSGLGLYGLSMLVWLMVLARVDVSMAYPFVGLGVVVTVLAGQFMLGEAVGPIRLAGCLLVALGIVLVARS